MSGKQAGAGFCNPSPPSLTADPTDTYGHTETTYHPCSLPLCGLPKTPMTHVPAPVSSLG